MQQLKKKTWIQHAGNAARSSKLLSNWSVDAVGWYDLMGVKVCCKLSWNYGLKCADKWYKEVLSEVRVSEGKKRFDEKGALRQQRI